MSQLRRIALVGNPNAGKTALFNALTGARQKIANYPGVTVERVAGVLSLPSGAEVELVDLPGSYSLDPSSPDEDVTKRVILGEIPGEARPDLIILVLDTNNLAQHLVFASEVAEIGIPAIATLNMADLARRDGLEIDANVIGQELGVTAVSSIAVRRAGLADLLAAIDDALADLESAKIRGAHGFATLGARRKWAAAAAQKAVISETAQRQMQQGLDAVFLHPIAGPIILFGFLFVMFQAVFSWGAPFVDGLDALATLAAQSVKDALPPSLVRDVLTEGVIAGVGAVVVFLPQIVILFAFILIMEASGYMTRAAFIMDRLMAYVGLSGRSFIPLLSSFACAIPGIMATRSISDPKDRLTTILIAPLMTCSARLPVYALIIAAVIPARDVGFGIGLQGLVLFALYVVGIVGAMVAALVLRRTVTKGGNSGFIMEMPRYQLPSVKSLLLGLWQRVWIFMRRAGTIIFGATIIIWLLLTFPKAGEGESQMDASFGGQIASAIHPVFAPIGFNREMTLSLIPAMAAREVAVSALATTYAVDSEDEDAQEKALQNQLAQAWSLPAALAFLAWFVFAPQCISTIAVTRRETNGWKWPIFMVSYLFGLAYIFAGITYWGAAALGL